MTKLIIADDHPIFRAGIKHILSPYQDLVVACEVDNGTDLLKKLRDEIYDILILDMYMPGRNGIDLIKQIKLEKHKLPILVLSSHKEDIFAVRTIKAGVSGYLCKDNASSDLVPAIRKVCSGGMYISPIVAEYLAKDINTVVNNIDPHTLLSNREFEIFLMIVSGLGPTEIANKLNLSIKTVSTHKVRIKEKRQLGSNTDFVLYAIKHGLMNKELGQEKRTDNQ